MALPVVGTGADSIPGALGAIDPTPTVAVVGIIEKPEHVTTQWFKDAGDAILLLFTGSGHAPRAVTSSLGMLEATARTGAPASTFRGNPTSNSPTCRRTATTGTSAAPA